MRLKNKQTTTKKKLPQKKSPYLVGFTGEVYQIFESEFYTVFSRKLEKEETPSNSLYEARNTLILKPEKDSTTKENYRPISPINRDEKALKDTRDLCINFFRNSM